MSTISAPAPKPAKPITMAHLCRDVSDVINQVRYQFDTARIKDLTMKSVSNLPEIKAAETLLERAAQIVLAANDLEMWQGACAAYYQTWIDVLAAEIAKRKQVA